MDLLKDPASALHYLNVRGRCAPPESLLSRCTFPVEAAAPPPCDLSFELLREQFAEDDPLLGEVL